jgi:hypothetical protein
VMMPVDTRSSIDVNTLKLESLDVVIDLRRRAVRTLSVISQLPVLSLLLSART